MLNHYMIIPINKAMIFDNDDVQSGTNPGLQPENAKPTAYKVDDDDNLEEKDLKRTYLFGDSEEKDAGQPGMESEGMGGQSFGKNNVTPSGDDKANPSRNAGYTNEYFRRTEPAEEHPENTNFKDGSQTGKPDYQQAQPSGSSDDTQPDENYQQPAPNNYQEGTADNDGKKNDPVNVPGPGEVPDQQKVGEANTSEPDKADYKPEYDEGKPDYGSNSPESH